MSEKNYSLCVERVTLLVIQLRDARVTPEYKTENFIPLFKKEHIEP
jgi:hypothetical protein